jgi:PAS domain S-box-containing protein
VTVVDTGSPGLDKAARPAASMALWGELVHSMRDIAYVLKPDGNYLEVNQQLTRVLRKPREQIIGQHFTIHLDKDQSAVAERIHKEMLSRRSPERSTRVFLVPDADPQYYEVIETPLIRGGEVSAIAGVGRDITQEASLEHKLWDAVESQRYALDFALRTSLGLVKGYIYTLGQSEVLSEDRRVRYIRIIEEEMDHLAKIIEDLLDFRRMEVGNYEFNEQPVQLPECIDLAVRQFKDEAARRAIKLVVDIPEVMDPLYLFSEAVNRVLTNLLQNAILHTMHSGRISIQVLDNDLYVDIIVQDNGVGIPEDELPYIFDKFFRGKSGDGTPSQGIGMGLAIVKTLVTAMGGKIWATSKVGQGSEFRLMLPRRLYSVPADDNSSSDPDASGEANTI